MAAPALTLPFVAKEEGLGGSYGDADTSFAITLGDGAGAGLGRAAVARLDSGHARANGHWPDATPERELIGFCDDWKSLT